MTIVTEGPIDMIPRHTGRTVGGGQRPWNAAAPAKISDILQEDDIQTLPTTVTALEDPRLAAGLAESQGDGKAALRTTTKRSPDAGG